MYAYAMVSDIHRNMLKNQEDADNQLRSASNARTLFTAEYILTFA